MFTQDQLLDFNARLQLKRSTLIAAKKAMQRDELEGLSPAATGELSVARLHPADLGSDVAAQETLSEIVAGETEEIHEIEAALNRMRDGIYGVCEFCQAMISLQRLEVMPEARFCEGCAETEGQQKAARVRIDLHGAPGLWLNKVPGVKNTKEKIKPGR